MCHVSFELVLFPASQPTWSLFYDSPNPRCLPPCGSSLMPDVLECWALPACVPSAQLLTVVISIHQSGIIWRQGHRASLGSTCGLSCLWDNTWRQTKPQQWRSQVLNWLSQTWLQEPLPIEVSYYSWWKSFYRLAWSCGVAHVSLCVEARGQPWMSFFRC